MWLCRPMREWQSLPQWLLLKVVSAGGARWPFLRLTLSSSDASCSFSSPLRRLRFSSWLQRNDPGQGDPGHQHPCQEPSCLFYRQLSIGVAGGSELCCLLRARRTAGPWGSHRPASCRRFLASEGDVAVAECRRWRWQHVWGSRCFVCGPTMWSPGSASCCACGECWSSLLSYLPCRVHDSLPHRLCRQSS